MRRPLDLLFVTADSALTAYQRLSHAFSAIEPPTWALLLAESCRSKGFGVGILDCSAESGGFPPSGSPTRCSSSTSGLTNRSSSGLAGVPRLCGDKPHVSVFDKPLRGRLVEQRFDANLASGVKRERVQSAVGRRRRACRSSCSHLAIPDDRGGVQIASSADETDTEWGEGDDHSDRSRSANSPACSNRAAGRSSSESGSSSSGGPM